MPKLWHLSNYIKFKQIKHYFGGYKGSLITRSN